MKLTWCFVLVNLVIIVQSFNLKGCWNADQKKTETVATALAIVLEKLSTQNAPVIKVIIRKTIPCQFEYIFEKVMKKNQVKFAVNIMSENSKYRETDFADKQSTFLPCDGLPTHLNISNNKVVLMYCPGMTAEELHTQVDRFSHEYPKGRSLKILIEHEDKFIDLMSTDHFTANQSKCRRLQLVHTNRFLMHEKRWQSEKFLTQPKRNFHGCEMRVTVFKVIDFVNILHDYHEHDDGSLEVKGLYVDIIKATAEKFNFSIYFMLTWPTKYKQKYKAFVEDDVILYERNTQPYSSNAFLYFINYIFLIPPGELYSDTEKLFMPLELEVWIASIITIFVALLTVQIINRLSRTVQNFVYGRNVTTPTLNIMIAFVGGGQMILPRRNFARFLLILFIFFSLIIRTCHQSKLFTYLQGDFVKSEITSIEELRERQFLFYDESQFFNYKNHIPKIKHRAFYKAEEARETFEKTLEPSLEVAVLTSDVAVAFVKSSFSSGVTSLNVLKETLYGKFMQFPHKEKSLPREQIDEVIGRLHSAGLIDLWYKRNFKYKSQSTESEPTPLTVEHLKAGFVVRSLITCCNAIK